MKRSAQKLGIALGLTAGAAAVIGLLYALTSSKDEPQAKAAPPPPPPLPPPSGNPPSSGGGWTLPSLPLPPIPWPFPILPQPLPPSKQG